MGRNPAKRITKIVSIADLINPEVDNLTAELKTLAKEKDINLADEVIDDVLTYALFPQIGLKFLENRNNPDAFEPIPSVEEIISPISRGRTRQLPQPGLFSLV